MPITIAPSDEACQAIVSWINGGSGLTYTLGRAAAYGYELTEDLKKLGSLSVDVIHLTESELDETLEIEQRTSHRIEVVVRKLVKPKTTAAIAALKLIVSQIRQRLNSFASARVSLWDVNTEDDEQPRKPVLRQDGLFCGVIVLRAEVEVSP